MGITVKNIKIIARGHLQINGAVVLFSCSLQYAQIICHSVTWLITMTKSTTFHSTFFNVIPSIAITLLCNAVCVCVCVHAHICRYTKCGCLPLRGNCRNLTVNWFHIFQSGANYCSSKCVTHSQHNKNSKAH